MQLDLKIDGIDLGLLESCLGQAKEARYIVLDKMNMALERPRQELSSYAPRIEIIKVNTEKMKEPSFLMILTGTEIAYRRNDGVFVVPIGCLKD